MGNYSHISRSVSCKWLSRLIRILIVKLLRFNNKKISLLLFANKICKRPGEKRCIVLNFFIIQGLKHFSFSHVHENSKFFTSFFTLCVTSNSLGMLLFLFKNCIFLQKPWNMYYVHILRLCKYLYVYIYNMYIFLF